MPLSSVLGASSAIRPGVVTSSTRPSVPYTGQTIYETDTSKLLIYNGSSWNVAGITGSIQTVTKTDAFSTTSTSFVDVTGLSVSITPTSSASRILVLFSISMAGSTTNDKYANLVRGSTAIAQSTGASNNATFYGYTPGTAVLNSWAGTFIDSPASTSSTTYKFQIKAGSDTAYVNRRGSDTLVGSISSITLIEIAP